MKNIVNFTFLGMLFIHQIVLPSIHENYTPSIYESKEQELSKAEIRSISPLHHLKMAIYKATGRKKVSVENEKTIPENVEQYYPVTATNPQKIQEYQDLIFDRTVQKASTLDHIKNAFKSLKYRYWTPRFNKQEHEEIDKQAETESWNNFKTILDTIVEKLKKPENPEAKNALFHSFNTLIKHSNARLLDPSNILLIFTFNQKPENLDSFITSLSISGYTADEKLKVLQDLKRLSYINGDKFKDVLKRINHNIVRLQIEINPTQLLSRDNKDIKSYIQMTETQQDFDNLNALLMQTIKSTLRPKEKIELLQSFFKTIASKIFDKKEQQDTQKEFLTTICLDIFSLQLEHNISNGIEENIANFYRNFNWDSQLMMRNFIEFFNELQTNSSNIQNQVLDILKRDFPYARLTNLQKYQNQMTNNIDDLVLKNKSEHDSNLDARIDLIKQLAKKTKRLIKFLQSKKSLI